MKIINEYLNFLNESNAYKGKMLGYDIYRKCHDGLKKCFMIAVDSKDIDDIISCNKSMIKCLNQNRGKCQQGMFGKKHPDVTNECEQAINEAIKHYEALIIELNK